MSTKRSNDGTAREDDAKKSKTESGNQDGNHHGKQNGNHHGNPQSGNDSESETLSIPSQDYRAPTEQPARSPCTDDSPYKYDHGPTRAGSQFR